MASENYKIFDQDRYIINDLNEWKQYMTTLGYEQLPTPKILNLKHIKNIKK